MEADAVFFPTAGQDEKGKLQMTLGVKGIAYFKLELDGKSWGYGPTEFADDSSLKHFDDGDGNTVLVEGFYDDVAPPSREDLELIERLEKTFDEETVKREMKVERFINDFAEKRFC
jgi:hypothetical protein